MTMNLPQAQPQVAARAAAKYLRKTVSTRTSLRLVSLPPTGQPRLVQTRTIPLLNPGLKSFRPVRRAAQAGVTASKPATPLLRFNQALASRRFTPLLKYGLQRVEALVDSPALFLAGPSGGPPEPEAEDWAAELELEAAPPSVPPPISLTELREKLAAQKSPARPDQVTSTQPVPAVGQGAPPPRPSDSPGRRLPPNTRHFSRVEELAAPTRPSAPFVPVPPGVKTRSESLPTMPDTGPSAPVGRTSSTRPLPDLSVGPTQAEPKASSLSTPQQIQTVGETSVDAVTRPAAPKSVRIEQPPSSSPPERSATTRPEPPLTAPAISTARERPPASIAVAAAQPFVPHRGDAGTVPELPVPVEETAEEPQSPPTLNFDSRPAEVEIQESPVPSPGQVQLSGLPPQPAPAEARSSQPPAPDALRPPTELSQAAGSLAITPDPGQPEQPTGQTTLSNLALPSAAVQRSPSPTTDTELSKTGPEVLPLPDLDLPMADSPILEETDRTGGSIPRMKISFGGTTPQAPRPAALFSQEALAPTAPEVDFEGPLPSREPGPLAGQVRREGVPLTNPQPFTRRLVQRHRRLSETAITWPALPVQPYVESRAKRQFKSSAEPTPQGQTRHPGLATLPTRPTIDLTAAREGETATTPLPLPLAIMPQPGGAVALQRQMAAQANERLVSERASAAEDKLPTVAVEPKPPGKETGPNLDQLARQIYPLIKRRLLIERQQSSKW